MTRTPEGETVWKAPIRFQTGGEVATALAVDLSGPANGKLSLVVRYGDRTLVSEFEVGSQPSQQPPAGTEKEKEISETFGGGGAGTRPGGRTCGGLLPKIAFPGFVRWRVSAR